MFGLQCRCLSLLHKGHSAFILLIVFSTIYKISLSSKTAGDSKTNFLKIPLKKSENILNTIYKRNSYWTSKGSSGFMQNNKLVNNKSELKRSRRDVIKHLSTDEVVNVEMTGTVGRSYYVEILIGTPPQSVSTSCYIFLLQMFYILLLFRFYQFNVGKIICNLVLSLLVMLFIIITIIIVIVNLAMSTLGLKRLLILSYKSEYC